MSKRWAIMERFEVPHFDRDDELYLTRWRIISTPLASLYLHRIGTPDSRPTLHDHPWSFVSIILRGGYTENRLNLHTRTVIRRHIRFVNVMRRDDAHAIMSLHKDRPVWSLLLVGRRRRTWGYWRQVASTSRAQWFWTPFDRDQHPEEFDAAIARQAAVLHAPLCKNEGRNCAWDAGAPCCGCNCHVAEIYRADFPLDGIDHLHPSGEPT